MLLVSEDSKVRWAYFLCKWFRKSRFRKISYSEFEKIDRLSIIWHRFNRKLERLKEMVESHWVTIRISINFWKNLLFRTKLVPLKRNFRDNFFLACNGRRWSRTFAGKQSALTWKENCARDRKGNFSFFFILFLSERMRKIAGGNNIYLLR